MSASRHSPLNRLERALAWFDQTTAADMRADLPDDPAELKAVVMDMTRALAVLLAAHPDCGHNAVAWQQLNRRAQMCVEIIQMTMQEAASRMQRGAL